MDNTALNDDILTVEEAAEVLKIAPEKVLDLLMSADLAGRNIGGSWRTTRRALLSFVDGAPIAAGCCGPGGVCCTPAGAAPGMGWS